MTNETLRDKIASSVRDYDGYNGNSSEVSDAILATIKASVPPLVWERIESTGARNVHNAIYGRYEYVAWPNGAWRIRVSRVEGLAETPTLEGAKAAAQAHHVAQLTGWMDQ